MDNWFVYKLRCKTVHFNATILFFNLSECNVYVEDVRAFVGNLNAQKISCMKYSYTMEWNICYNIQRVKQISVECLLFTLC